MKKRTITRKRSLQVSRIFFALLLTLSMVLTAGSVSFAASDRPKDASLPLEPEVTSTEGAQNYGNYIFYRGDGIEMTHYDFNASPVYAYLMSNEDGTFTRVEFTNDGVVALEDYDKNYRLIWKQTVPFELDYALGFYEGTDYNFLAFGAANPDEDDSKEVLRIVRYTKNWHRVDAAGVFGSNTYDAWYDGTLRMAQVGDYLYVHGHHAMYADENGTHHQANMSVTVRISDMKTWRVESGVSDYLQYTSHSFNQFVIADGDRVVYLDQGDAAPRSLQLCVRGGASRGVPANSFMDRRNIMEFLSSGYYYNYTGASVGGLEASSTHYLAVGTTVDQETYNLDTDPGNVFVIAVPKAELDGDFNTMFMSSRVDVNCDTRYLTNHKDGEGMDGDGLILSTPHLVKTGTDSFAVLWTESKNYDSHLYYTFINGKGESLTPVYSMDGKLSICKPVVAGDSIVWYVTENSAPKFYSIPLEHRFTDVPVDAYFAKAVDWAVEHKPQITNGLSGELFGPEQVCTRGQAVTFLWRASGEPKVSGAENPFSDVKKDDYYYNAVLWAYQNGVTEGTSETAFSPGETCSRGQIVTFLWRAQNRPKAGAAVSFKDVGKDAYYFAPVQWAVEKGVTNGTSDTTFSPAAFCTRGQIVTFLYRALG